MNLLALLKYLDPKKITPEAVEEICASLSRKVSKDQAAEISNAFKTRGVAGLLPFAPLLLPQSTPDPKVILVYECKSCGALGRIETTISQLRASGSIVDP